MLDLFVIGAGSGGVRAARLAASYGATVMVAEEHRIGGTCVIRGCVPKKLLVYASRFREDFANAAGYGWTIGEPEFSWRTLLANKDHEIDRLEKAYTTTLERHNVKLVRSRAVLHDANTVKLANGESVRAKTILIATGGWPYCDSIPGIEHVISSNEAFHLDELPRRVLIQGGGYIAVEFASVFAGLGSKVTLVHRGRNILRGFDDDVREHLRDEMTKQGIVIACGHTVVSVEKTAASCRASLSDGSQHNADLVMFATGRRPNVKGLGLKAAGVKLAGNGGIAVNCYSQTSVSSIYAVGDVTNRVNLTPVAIREGHAFADTVFGNKPTIIDYSNIPTAVFAAPEVGTVGLTEAEAVKEMPVVDIYKSSFRPMKAALAGRNTCSFFKLVVDGETDRVVGCHIVGANAGELIQLAGIAVKMKATKTDLDSVMAVHPTAAEELVTMREKAVRYDRNSADPLSRFVR